MARARTLRQSTNADVVRHVEALSLGGFLGDFTDRSYAWAVLPAPARTLFFYFIAEPLVFITLPGP